MERAMRKGPSSSIVSFWIKNKISQSNTEVNSKANFQKYKQ